MHGATNFIHSSQVLFQTLTFIWYEPVSVEWFAIVFGSPILSNIALSLIKFTLNLNTVQGVFTDHAIRLLIAVHKTSKVNYQHRYNNSRTFESLLNSSKTLYSQLGLVLFGGLRHDALGVTCGVRQVAPGVICGVCQVTTVRVHL